MTSKKEQFYIQRISELEAQLKQRDERIVKLEKEVAELKQTIHHLTEQIAKLSKNSSNSSKPPSSDIVKPPKSATLAKRIRKHGDAIFRFLFDPAVPPTNNGGEQSIRQLVIDRRITQGSRSPMGRQWNARVWMVLDTCRKQGRSAWQFLQNALSAYYFRSPTPSLLPQA